MSTFYKSQWEPLRFFPWLEVRIVIAETSVGRMPLCAWNEYRFTHRKAGAR